MGQCNDCSVMPSNCATATTSARPTKVVSPAAKAEPEVHEEALPHPHTLDFRLATFLRRSPPRFGEGIRLGIWQADGNAGTPEAVEENLARLERICEAAAAQGVQLLSFPELYTSGYCLTPETSRLLAEAVDGPSLQRVAAAAKRFGLAVACPYPEKGTVAGEVRFYDSIALFGSDGILLKNYRKTHLWGPDEKLVWSPGYEKQEEGPSHTAHKVNGVPIGLLNCYEGEFPELFRRLALNGAKLILVPTAADEWCILSTGEKTAMPYPDVSMQLLPAHAYQNDCFVAYSNRAGYEAVNGKVMGKFLGNSIVCGPHGDILCKARPENTLLIADCIPADYGPTHPCGTSYLKDRRPELY